MATGSLGPVERRPPPPPDPRRRARTIALAAGAAILVAAGTVAVLRIGADRRERDAAERRERLVAERARLARIQAPRRGAAPKLRAPADAPAARRRAARAALVAALERDIARDARTRAREGELRGPVRAVVCGPFLRDADAVPDDRVLAKDVGRYDCLAARRSAVDGSGRQVATLGYPFVAAVDFRRFTYVWCRNTPPPSERGETLAFVRLDRACLAAKGPPVGTGYADVPAARAGG